MKRLSVFLLAGLFLLTMSYSVFAEISTATSSIYISSISSKFYNVPWKATTITDKSSTIETLSFLWKNNVLLFMDVNRCNGTSRCILEGTETGIRDQQAEWTINSDHRDEDSNSYEYSWDRVNWYPTGANSTTK